jgi:hypothetical protein
VELRFRRGARTATAKTFAGVGGAASRGILLTGNDLSRVERSMELAGAPKTAVPELANAGPVRPR